MQDLIQLVYHLNHQIYQAKSFFISTSTFFIQSFVDNQILLPNFGYQNLINIYLMQNMRIQSQLVGMERGKSLYLYLEIKLCTNLYPSRAECFQIGNLYKFIKPRAFILQSQYDSWGLIEVIQLKCVPDVRPSNLAMCNDTERTHIQRYRAKINEAVQNFTSVEKNGVWSISCVQHGFLDDSLLYVNSHDYRAPSAFGKTILAAIMNFINDTGQDYIDDADWPFNIGCNGLRKNKRHLIGSTG